MDSNALCERKQTDLATLAGEINEHHRQAEEAGVSALKHAHEAGLRLLEAKRGVDHGAWGKWLKANFEGSKRTAQVYMQIADSYNWERIQKRTGVALLQFDEHLAIGIKSATKLLAKPRPAVKSDEEIIDVKSVEVVENVEVVEDDHGEIAEVADADFDPEVGPCSKDGGEHVWRKDDGVIAGGRLCLKCRLTLGEIWDTEAGDADAVDARDDDQSSCPKGGEHVWTEDESGRYCSKCKEPGALEQLPESPRKRETAHSQLKKWAATPHSDPLAEAQRRSGCMGKSDYENLFSAIDQSQMLLRNYATHGIKKSDIPRAADKREEFTRLLLVFQQTANLLVGDLLRLLEQDVEAGS